MMWLTHFNSPAQAKWNIRLPDSKERRVSDVRCVRGKPAERGMMQIPEVRYEDEDLFF